MKKSLQRIDLMLNNYEMSSVCVDTGVMWRLSEDFNRRFVARVQQQSHHLHSHHHHHHHRPPASMTMLYNGKRKTQNPVDYSSFICGLLFLCSYFYFPVYFCLAIKRIQMKSSLKCHFDPFLWEFFAEKSRVFHEILD